MSITNELREWGKRWEDVVADEIAAIADRIDERHEQMQYDYQHEFDGWKFIRDTQWVELPKDADGVPWHIGDSTVLEGRAVTVCGFKAMMTEVYQCNVTNEVLKWHMYFSGDKGFAYECDKFHHVQPDTRERLIEDGVRLVSDNVARRTEMECGEVLKQDAFDALMDGFNIGRARGYDEGFGAHLADLEARVERIEKLLNHKGA